MLVFLRMKLFRDFFLLSQVLLIYWHSKCVCKTVKGDSGKTDKWDSGFEKLQSNLLVFDLMHFLKNFIFRVQKLEYGIAL